MKSLTIQTKEYKCWTIIILRVVLGETVIGCCTCNISANRAKKKTQYRLRLGTWVWISITSFRTRLKGALRDRSYARHSLKPRRISLFMSTSLATTKTESSLGLIGGLGCLCLEEILWPLEEGQWAWRMVWLSLEYELYYVGRVGHSIFSMAVARFDF
jgi:hypothetical protein